MAYNKDTDFENERKYLDNLSKNGNAGQKAWAENQKKELDSAQAKYGSTSTSTNSGKSNGSNSQYTNVSSGTSSNRYTIGSSAGKQIAESLPIGDSYRASDGSVWKKQPDGSITVTSKSGNVTNGAYQMSDLGTLGRQQVAAGVPFRYVVGTQEDRIQKALSTPGLEQYAYDGVYDFLQEYIDSKSRERQDYLAQRARENNAVLLPEQVAGYNSKYDPQIEALLGEILTRDDFAYDVAKDPLYQQFAQMYQRDGDRAMRETMAEAASGAGGMNTYAITAAQQAQNYYNSQLNDMIPQLYQLAYDMYLNDKESKVQDLGLLQALDETQYGRYIDTMNSWRNDRDFAYQMYQDNVAQNNWQQTFDYNKDIDERSANTENYWNQLNWNTQAAEKEKESATEQVLAIIESGGIPSSTLVASSNLAQETVDALVAAKKADDVNYIMPVIDEPTENGGITGNVAQSSFKGVENLNLGPKSDEFVVSLYDAGLINVDADGRVSWKAGVNEKNYMTLLNGTGFDLPW